MPFDTSLLEEEESGFDPLLLEEEPEPISKLEQANADLRELGSVLAQRRREQGGTISVSEPGFLSRLRTSDLGRRLLGPTREERSAMVAQQPGVVDIGRSVLKFTTAPPQVTEPIQQATEPLISRLPPVAAGITRGVRDVALGAIGSLPAGALMPARMVAAPFATDYASTIPEQFQAIQESETPEQAAQALTTTGLGGALTIAGTAQALRSPDRISIEPQDRPVIERTPDADQVISPETIHADVRSPAIEVTQEMSAQASAERIPTSEGQAPQGEVLLRKPVEPGTLVKLKDGSEAVIDKDSGADAVDITKPSGATETISAEQVWWDASNVPEASKPILVNANRQGNTIRLEFDTAHGPITAEQIQQMLSGPDRSVEVVAFEPNEFSTAQGRANFSAIIGTPEGPYSTDLAKKTYQEAFGTSEDIKGKSTIESVFPFEERLNQSLRKSAEREAGVPPKPETPVALDPTPSTAAGDLDLQAVSPEAAQAAPKKAGKWTAATSEDWQALSAPGGELGAFIPNPLTTIKAAAAMARIAGRAAAPHIQRAGRAIADIAKEATSTPKMTDYRRSVLNWSSKLQRSFAEAESAQEEIMSKIPDATRREGITNWIQADGDPAVLTARAAASTDPKLKAGYEAALALTPPETALAIEIKAAFDDLGLRGQAHDVVNNFKDNYVTQIWDLGKGSGGSRTLKDNFRYNKARTFQSYFDGEQAGFSPKTKDIAKILPVYLHEMNSVIAARQMVQQMAQGVASDGRPLVAPRGTGTSVASGGSQATLIMPKAVKGDTKDYKVLANQPALSDWRWASKDSAGNPVFQKSDLALHPEAFDRLKSVLGRSAIRDWYETRTSAVAQIPKAIVKGLDIAQSETKRTMLGLFAPFHQVQEGTHAVGHRISPFKVPKVDLAGDAKQLDATKHGLMMLPDRASESQFMEGFRTSGIVSRIPGIGPLADTYSRYLFHDYIPGLKYKTYEAILERNSDVYKKDLASGSVNLEDIKVLSAEQANAAYGHLNYADLGRNPTIQHLLQLGLLAPDFLEARGRFLFQAVKGATGAKVGREQLIALSFLAVAQATTAWTAAQLSGGEWDARHPFEFHVGSRKYTMRSVPEDVDALISHTRSFVHSRLSPLIGKGAIQYSSGRDYRGQKVSAAQTTKELATAPIPLTVRSVPGLRHLTGQDRPGAVSPLEQLGGSIGLKISRYYPNDKIRELHSDWMKNNPDEKIKADYERNQAATYPISRYKALDSALADKDQQAARKAIKDLQTDGAKRSDIYKRFNPYTADGSQQKPLFHESAQLESKFRKSLTPEQKKLYDEARQDRKDQWKLFRKVFQETPKE